MIERKIRITNAAYEYGNINLSSCGCDFFPKEVFGQPSRREGLGKPITLNVEGFQDPVITDIPTDRKTGKPRWIFRERKWVKDFVKYNKLSPGDYIIIKRLNRSKYSITKKINNSGIDLFEDSLSPVDYAQSISDVFLSTTSMESRKQRGQYFTPVKIAEFMATLAVTSKQNTIRILDPGAGTGILSCAVCEELSNHNHIKEIVIDAYENDAKLIKYLKMTYEHANRWLKNNGITLKYNLFNTDYIAAAVQSNHSKDNPLYDVIVSNPPYFKISAKDQRAVMLKEVIHGQPNIYALFMAASAQLLNNPSGSLVFITPRSFASGNYFKSFRKYFLSHVNLTRIHLFESRKDVFSKQSVLQESVILQAKRGKPSSKIIISTSKDCQTLNKCHNNTISAKQVLFKRGDDIIVRMPLNEIDDLAIKIVDSWKTTLLDYGLKVSTGPVVPFRAEKYISQNPSSKMKLAPLVWMQNIRPMQTVWPNGEAHNKKSCNQFIVDSEETRKRKLLVPNKNTVLIRRFSAKEQKRRLMSAPLFHKQLHYEYVGIENHLNYIRRLGGELTADEVRGLSAVLNCVLMDNYFRICNGNTQVGAQEIEMMPIPPISTIIAIGKCFRRITKKINLMMIDKIVLAIIEKQCKEKHLFERLCP